MSNAPVFEIDPDRFRRDPYPDLAAMRATAPIAFVPQLGATLITRRDDIAVCEKNVAVFSSDQPGGLMNVLMGQNMMRRDGAEHQAERRVYQPAIAVNAVREVWRSEFEAHAARLLDELEPLCTADLVTEYAMPLSGAALASMTGLTGCAPAQLDAWSQAMIDGIANYAGDPAVEANCRAATAEIDAAIDAALAAPGSDAASEHSLLSVMIASGMPTENARANIKLTISGGQNEPRDAIAGCVWAVLTHPEQLRLVRDGAANWADVFEEYCRWIAPIGMSPRRVARDDEYGGVEFEEGERVFLMFGSANRDESHFERPDVFDITRDTKMNLTFGAGPHFCAGAAASRSLVAEVALPMLFDRLGGFRLDGLHLDPAGAPVEFGGWAFRGPLQVPVAWA
jgi:cytochrome P450